MRTKEEITEEIEYYTEFAEECTNMAEYYTKWAEEHTKKAEELNQELKDTGNEN